MKVEVDVDIDLVLDGTYAIVITNETIDAPLLFLPGEIPCICDTFQEAVTAMRQALKAARK